MKKLCISLLALITLFSITSFAEGWQFDGANWKYEDKDGNYVTGEIKKSNGISYYLDDDGNMATDYLAEVKDNLYYFDQNGAMVTNTWVALDPSMIEDQPFDAAAYFMYFQNNGKAIKGEDGKKKTIDGKTYMFNDKGIMMIGWLTENGEFLDDDESDDWYSSEAMYYAREDGSLAEGWLPLSDYQLEEDITNAAGDYLNLETIWFYFDPSSHKKATDEKSINGKKYNFFPDNGRMMTNWEQLEIDSEFIATSSNNRYYGNYNDGSLKKNEWIYDIPSSVIDSEAYDDYEYNWYRTNAKGGITTNCIKKIDGKKYCFDNKGKMRTGLLLFYKGRFYCEIDRERTTYADFVKRYMFYPVESDIPNMVIEINSSGSDDWRAENYYSKNRLYKNALDLSRTTCGESGTPQFTPYEEGGRLIKEFLMMKTSRQTLNTSTSAMENIMDRIPTKNFTIRYFGEDGAERYGSSMIHFPDGDYEFVSDSKGGYIDWHDDKFYQNGFLVRSYDDQKYVMFFVSEVLPGKEDGGFDGLPLSRSVSNEMGNYSSQIFSIAAASGATKEQFMFKLEQKGYPGWLGFACPGFLQYTPSKNDNTKSILHDLEFIPTGGGLSTRFCRIADKKGKNMKKGAYKDGDMYLLVNTDGQFVGAFDVPIKWGKLHREYDMSGASVPEYMINKTFDWPYYKSDKVTYKENGEEVWKMNTWIPFTFEDAYGNTELDFVHQLEVENCGNFVPGVFDGTHYAEIDNDGA